MAIQPPPPPPDLVANHDQATVAPVVVYPQKPDRAAMSPDIARAAGNATFSDGTKRDADHTRLASPAFAGPDGLPPQQGRSASAAQTSNSYVRLTVHVEKGVLSITDSREVAGPLAETTTLATGLAHEVRIGDRRVALGSTPDAHMSRSFNNIGAGPREHHLQNLESFDFVVRMPASALVGVDPKTVAINVVHVDSVADHAALVGPQHLNNQANLQVRPVSTLQGIEPTKLPPTVQRLLRQ
jgi:hypothetical protein